MTIRRGKTEGTATVALQGPLTLGPPAECLLSTIRDLLAVGVREIRLDASRIPYADARGLGAIAECHKRAADAGGRFTVEEATGKLREELAMTGLLDEEQAAAGHRLPKPAGRRARAVKPFLRIVNSGAA